MKRGKWERGVYEQALLNGLDGVMSENQIRQIAATALLCLDEDGLERVIERLDQTTGDDLRLAMETWREVIEQRDQDERLQQAGRHGASSRSPEELAVFNEWSAAWGDWQAIIAETLDEEGAYVSREHQWEEPYVSFDEISQQLDDVAQRMLPLIPQIIESDLDPDFSFAETISEANSEICSELPDGIDGWDSEGYFGPMVTRCLLEWEWRAALAHADEEAPPSAFDLMDLALRLCGEEGVSLDSKEILAFALELDENHLRDIHQGILEHFDEPRWETILQDVRSGYFGLYKDLLRRFEPADHLELCKANIEKEWRLSLPVLKDLVDHQKHVKADVMARRAIRAWLPSYSRRSERDKNDPEVDLFIADSLRVDDDESALQLFELWAAAARGAGQEELAAALDIQRLALTSWQEWDEMLRAFENATAAGFDELSDRLYERWRHLVSTQSHYSYKPQVSWVDLLADAARQGWKAPAFHDALRQWLLDVSSSKESMTAYRYSLDELTHDLDRGEIREVSPTLHELVSPSYLFGKDALITSRRTWLERLEGMTMMPDLIECWRRGVAFLVPDPDKAREHTYFEEVRWLQAVYDLDRPGYNSIIAQWQQEHRRKRNLWAAIRSRRLPVPGK
jgi:hypothetical protein